MISYEELDHFTVRWLELEVLRDALQRRDTAIQVVFRRHSLADIVKQDGKK